MQQQRVESAGRRMVGPATTRLLLRVLMGETVDLELGGRRFRLGLEKAFRLEEVGGPFLFYMGTAGAAARRIINLAGGGPVVSRLAPVPRAPDN
jgi:hypothetical protein